MVMALIKVMRGTLSAKCMNYLKINAAPYHDFITLQASYVITSKLMMIHNFHFNIPCAGEKHTFIFIKKGKF